MPKLKLTVPHNLGTEEAKGRICHLLADTRQEIGRLVSDLEESWNGNVQTFRFVAMGFRVSGRLSVEPAAILVEIELPLAALPWKKKLETEILTRAKAVLA